MLVKAKHMKDKIGFITYQCQQITANRLLMMNSLQSRIGTIMNRKVKNGKFIKANTIHNAIYVMKNKWCKLKEHIGGTVEILITFTIKYLPTEIDTANIKTPRIGASWGARANSMHMVPVTC